MSDPTEDIRRDMVTAINAEPKDRPVLEAAYGQVWDTGELQQDFSVQGFGAPLVIVVRKADGVIGSLMFQHRPRFYFNFQADRP